ncbi:hypothetical protein K492DRAFT_31609 [Lichtheimia hyalospora FSU 10163]|nr:hypothetical protein K492DRAFT_31609 [Lichtheimia hyalospora FSU 10163]
MKQKSTKSKQPVWTVFFFGSRDYGFFGPEMIRPFDPVVVERDMKAKKFKTRELENAVRQALDPSLLEEEEQEDDDEEDEEEEEEEEEIITTKKTRGRSKAASTKSANAGKKKTTPKRSKSRSKEEEEEEVESNPVKAKRRSRKLEETDKDVIHEADSGRKKRRKSVSSSDKEEGRVSPAASQRNTSEPEKPKDEAAEYDKERMRMYRLRHKLQKLVYQKKPGEISKDEYPVISQVLKSVEESNMTPQLLRDTKIGQVVKSAGLYVYEDDVEYNIQARAKQLMARWRESFTSASARQQATTNENGSNGNKSTLTTGTASATPEPQPKEETKKQDTMQANESSATAVDITPSNSGTQSEGTNGQVTNKEQSSNGDDNGINGDNGIKAEAMTVDENDGSKPAASVTTTTTATPTASVDTVMQEAS